MKKKIVGGGILFLVLLTMCVSFVACGGVTYTMSAESVSIEMGQTSSALKVYETDSEGAMTVVSDLAWSSSDSTVATVDETTGMVTGVASGTVTITATGSTGSGTYEVVVVDQVTYTAASASASISPEETFTVSMLAGGKAVTTDVTYSSSNTSAATVSSSGVVTGVAQGTTTITMTRYGNTATVAITVTPPREISESAITTGIGDETTLTVSEDGVEVTSGITWTTSDSSVATVANGVVTGTGAGSATITASYDGSTMTCEVTGVTYIISHSQDSIGIVSSYEANTFYKTSGSWTVTDGALTLTSTSSNSSSSSNCPMARYMPYAADGVSVANGEKITFTYTLTNNTDESGTFGHNQNGSDTTWFSLAAGASATKTYSFTADSSKQLNLKGYGYGVGSYTYSNMYVTVA